MHGTNDYELICAHFNKAQDFVRSYLNVEISLKFKCCNDIETIGNITSDIFENLAYRVLYSGKPICVFDEQMLLISQNLNEYYYKLIQCYDIYFILCIYGENICIEKATEICSAFISQGVLSIKQQQFLEIKHNADKANSFITGCAALSHEFKNPLNVILTSLQLLKIKLKQNAPNDFEKHYDQLLSFSEENTMKISRLSSNFLDGAKLEIGEVQLTLRLEKFCDKAQQSVQQMSVICMKYGIRLIFKDLTNNCEMCFIDDVKIDIIILNLLSNAIYSICETKKKNGEIAVEVTNDANYFYVNVQDNGKGISQEYVSNVFDAFFSKRSLRAVEGSGLGLAICKELVILHKGEISAKRLNIGVCFTFSVYRGLALLGDDEELLNSDANNYNDDYYKNMLKLELVQLEHKINKLY